MKSINQALENKIEKSHYSRQEQILMKQMVGILHQQKPTQEGTALIKIRIRNTLIPFLKMIVEINQQYIKQTNSQ